MADDYYVILGVPVDAAPDEIRSAFRRLARRHHPDRRGESGSSAFRSVSEAYDVLSDPVRRARYDREQRRRLQRPASSPPQGISEVEPLISEPLPVAARTETVRPSLEALLERLSRNFAAMGVPKAERAEPLNFELILTPEEARRGVVIPFQVPVFSVCSDCGGLGRAGLMPCGPCDGQGRIVDRDEFRVRVPARVADGTVIELSLEELGIRNLWLRLIVRISAH